MLRGSAVIAAIALSQMIVAGPLAAEPREAGLRVAQAVVADLPPYEMLAVVRSMGLRPISQPVREGPTYVLRAVDRRGEERRVVVDARYGEVIEAVRVVRMPGYPGARVVRLPGREFEEDEIDMTPPSPYPPRVIPAPRASAPAPRAAAIAPSQQPAHPPVPRPRPDLPQTAAAPASVMPVAPTAAEPVEAKPVEVKPAETKPVEAKPKPFVPDVVPLD